MAFGAALAEEEPLPPFVKYTITGQANHEQLGFAVDAMGDVDGDEIPDLLVGIPEFSADDEHLGRVAILSGRDGSEIRTWRHNEPSPWYGYFACNAGDIDGDGVNDVLAGNTYFLEQRSGRTGALIGKVYPGGAVWAVGDINRDEIPDFVMADRNSPHPAVGRFTAYSGATRQVLWIRDSEGKETHFGWTLAVIDDLDGDGIQDFAAGEVTNDEEIPVPGRVHFLSGRDGSVIKTLVSDVPGDYFGSSIETMSDVDGDGTRELAIGVSGHAVLGWKHAGRVDLVNPRTGNVIWSQFGVNGDHSGYNGPYLGDAFGSLVRSPGDVDLDGFQDLLVTCPRMEWANTDDWTQVHLCSGKTGEILAVYEGKTDFIHFGWRVSRLGDVDADRRPEFVIGAPEFPYEPWKEIWDIGRLHVITFLPDAPRYIRGDADSDGDVDLTDAIVILLHIAGGGPVPCEEGMDVSRNNLVNLTDALLILGYRFVSILAPDPPFPACGPLQTMKPTLPCQRSFCD